MHELFVKEDFYFQQRKIVYDGLLLTKVLYNIEYITPLFIIYNVFIVYSERCWFC